MPLHLRQWIATIIGLALLGWQAVAVARHIPGPGTPAGSLALWGWRQDADRLRWPIAVAAALVVVGVVLLRRTSLDALARRSGLVAQLRFAVTMQDLRTVILLRRQLNQEQSRGRPWLRVPRTRHEHAVWRRGWHSLLRMPATRIVRMAALAAAGRCVPGARRPRHHPGAPRARRRAVHPRAGGDGAAVAGGRSARPGRQPARSTAVR